MSRSTEQRVTDILQAIDRCQRYVDSLDSEDRDLVDMAEDAVEPQIRGFRNILVHEYFGVDVATVRDVIETHLPPLVEALRGHSGD